MSTSHNQRAAMAAYRAQFPNASHTRALNAVRAGWHPTSPSSRAYPGELGAATPPEDWKGYPERSTAIAALWRDRDGDGRVDELAVFDTATGARISSLTVPHSPSPDPAAIEQAIRSTGATPTSPAGREKAQQAELGHPHRLLHRLNHQAFFTGLWQRWSDGSWRIAAEPTDFTHSVTVTTVDAATHRVRLEVTEHPDTIVVDEVVGVRFSPQKPGEPYFVALKRLLDRYGYVAEYGYFSEISPGVGYERVRPGRLAQRHWRTRAELRVLHDFTSRPGEGRPRTFRAGETVVMQQEGSAGQEVRRGSWHSNSDLEVSLWLNSRNVEVVRTLEDLQPMHADAAIDPAVLIELLAPHHPGATEAVTAWVAAGLHLSLGTRGVEIRTPAPRYRLIGQIGRDPWNSNAPSKPYTAVLRENRDRPWNSREIKQPGLPLDPLAVITDAQRVDTVNWTLPSHASVAQLEATVEALLRHYFPEQLADEIVDDDSGLPTGLEALVDVARQLAKDGPNAVSEAFAAVAGAHADPTQLDELLYAPRGAGRVLADRIKTLRLNAGG
ncbi:hypothetical protein GCM10027258_92970 [Amycolatopsis stemonae]